MANFFASENNGVTALISEEHAQLYELISRSGGDPIKAGVRVFTFCSADRIERRPDDRFIFTGTDGELDLLMIRGGHHIVDGHGGWIGYVPFSNGIESGSMGKEAQQEELRYRTTLRDVIDVFGCGVLSKSER